MSFMGLLIILFWTTGRGQVRLQRAGVERGRTLRHEVAQWVARQPRSLCGHGAGEGALPSHRPDGQRSYQAWKTGAAKYSSGMLVRGVGWLPSSSSSVATLEALAGPVVAAALAPTTS